MSKTDKSSNGAAAKSSSGAAEAQGNGATETKAADGGEAGKTGGQQPTPETLAKLAEFRSKLAATFSQVTMSMLATPRYRNLSIADLEWLVLEPLLRDRIAIASAKKTDSEAPGGMIGLAIWAKVSDEVSRRIEEQVKAGNFPVRLKADDWNSGETVWLLDVIAPNRQLSTNVLVSFGQLAKGAPVRIHPLVGRMVDPEVLSKLSGAPAPKDAQESAGE